MARCNGCQAEIEWIKTRAGRSMPVDPGEFPLVPDAAGNVIGVTGDGEVIKGRTCSESYESERWVYARISHFATCPAAESFRRRQ
jgi:hypothetical protein